METIGNQHCFGGHSRHSNHSIHKLVGVGCFFYFPQRSRTLRNPTERPRFPDSLKEHPTLTAIDRANPFAVLTLTGAVGEILRDLPARRSKAGLDRVHRLPYQCPALPGWEGADYPSSARHPRSEMDGRHRMARRNGTKDTLPLPQTKRLACLQSTDCRVRIQGADDRRAHGSGTNGWLWGEHPIANSWVEGYIY